MTTSKTSIQKPNVPAASLVMDLVALVLAFMYTELTQHLTRFFASRASQGVDCCHNASERAVPHSSAMTREQQIIFNEAQMMIVRVRSGVWICNRNGRLIIGPPASCKTTMLQSIAASAKQQGLRTVWLTVQRSPEDMSHRSVFSALFGCVGGLQAYRRVRFACRPPTAVVYSGLLRDQAAARSDQAYLKHPGKALWNASDGSLVPRPGRVVILLDDIHNCFRTPEGVELIYEIRMLLNRMHDECWIVATGNEDCHKLCYNELSIEEAHEKGYLGYTRTINLNYTKLQPRFLTGYSAPAML